jgi:hypothetical protein
MVGNVSNLSYFRPYTPSFRKPKKTTPKPTSTPPAGVAFDPMDSLLQSILQGPDFSGIPEYTPEQIDEMASSTVAKYLKPYEDMQAQAYRRSQDMFTIGSEQATNFSKAMASILQGGLTGEAGMQYAHDNFGGSYLGAMAAQQGAQIILQLTNDWQERDFEIGDKYAEILGKRPELEEEVRQNLLKGVSEQRDAVMDDYKWKMDFYAWFKKNVVGGDANGKPITQKIGGDLFQYGPDGWTKVIEAGQEATQPMTRTVGGDLFENRNGKWVKVIESGDSGVSPSQMNSYLKTANQIYNQATKQGAKKWKAVAAARQYLADNGLQAKAWRPYTPGESPGTTKKVMTSSAALSLAKNRQANGKTIWDIRPTANGGWEAYDTGRPKPKKSGTSGLTPDQRNQNMQDAGQFALGLYYGTVEGKPANEVEGFDAEDPGSYGSDAVDYQEALRRIKRRFGLSTGDAVGILDELYDTPGADGRPWFSFSERSALRRAGYSSAQISKAMRPSNRNSPLALEMLQVLGRA